VRNYYLARPAPAGAPPPRAALTPPELPPLKPPPELATLEEEEAKPPFEGEEAVETPPNRPPPAAEPTLDRAKPEVKPPRASPTEDEPLPATGRLPVRRPGAPEFVAVRMLPKPPETGWGTRDVVRAPLPPFQVYPPGE
jgi:hypothetical protein